MNAHPTPLAGDLAVELANTLSARRGRVVEGLGGPADLARWLERVGARLPVALSATDLAGVGRLDLDVALQVRDGFRTLLAAGDAAGPLDARAVDALNDRARAVPRWRELVLEPEVRLVVRSRSRAVETAIALLAEEALRLAAGPGWASLHACAAPGCIRYFRGDHPRRAFCSPACGARARSARHYAAGRLRR